MVFLWTVVIVMAVALAVELWALVSLTLLFTRRAREVAAWTDEMVGNLKSSAQAAKEFGQSLQPHIETLRSGNKEIGTVVAARYRAVRAACSDAGHRAQRIRLRLNSEGIQTVEQLQRGEEVFRDLVRPARTLGQFVRGVSAALWFLRRVA